MEFASFIAKLGAGALLEQFASEATKWFIEGLTPQPKGEESKGDSCRGCVALEAELEETRTQLQFALADLGQAFSQVAERDAKLDAIRDVIIDGD